jgi:hypothetical protein
MFLEIITYPEPPQVKMGRVINIWPVNSFQSRRLVIPMAGPSSDMDELVLRADQFFLWFYNVLLQNRSIAVVLSNGLTLDSWPDEKPLYNQIIGLCDLGYFSNSERLYIG